MESQLHECYLFSDLSPSMMPISGLVSLDAGFDFVGYVSIGEQETMLFPLYCLSMSLGALRHQISLIGYIATPIMHNGMEIVHHSMYEPGSVPIYTQHAEPSGKLDLAHQAYTVTDHLLYITYDWPTPGIQKTMALLAQYPQGRGPIDIVVTLSQLFQPFQTSIVAPEFNDYEPFESHPIVSEPESPVFGELLLGQTLNVAEVLVDSSVPSVNMTGCTTNLDDDVTQPEVQADGTDTLSTIQDRYPQWKAVLVHLRLEMRSDVAHGIPINLFLLTQANYSEERKQFVSELFQRSLTAVGIDSASLGRVISSDGHTHITEDAILGMVGKWLSALLSLMKRAATIAIADGGLMNNFTLQNPCPFALQSDMCSMCVQLMNMFMSPNSTRFPIATNDFVRFLRMSIAKSLVHYLVYWPTKSANVIRTMADINRPIFRHASHLPPATLAFLGACCYSALLSYLIDTVKAGGVSTNLSQFPSVSEVYDELLRMAMDLFAQQGDPELPILLIYLAGFCNLKPLSYSHRCQNRRCTATASILACKPSTIASLLPTPNTLSTRNLLGEHTENTLKSWLQKQGRDILPESLLITASVLFGWVDPLDLIAVLHISLRVAAVERQLQQEEYTDITFLVQGGRCWMEERRYRAQMELSLFSKAIENVYEELNTQYHPSTREKCEAWLSTSWQFQMDFPRTQEIPQFHQHVLKPNNSFLPLPCLIKPWVSSVTYGDYVSASCAVTKPIRLDNPNDFKTKEDKPLDVLKSDFHILQLMKRRAQSEVDMFSEAIARTAGIGCTNDGTCTSSGSATTYESHLPSNFSDNRSDDWFDNWFDGSISSNASVLT
ncbi:hypothetical protein C8R48DRAFT_780511 [Suillus tomentosus]|nr:hypothetical protein C8R48DRAFT_780511 [Suillus tomentosus]